MSGARGHHESFHKAFFKGLQSHDRVKNPIYLGSRKYQLADKSWYEPQVPSRLTSKFKVMDLKYFKTLLHIVDVKNSNSVPVFVAYEGNLFTVFIFSAVLRLRPKAFAIINIFDNQQIVARLESKHQKYYYKMLCNIALEGIKSRIVITGDTSRFAGKLQNSIKLHVETFPMFSSLSTRQFKSQKSCGYFINLRGERSALKLLQICNPLGDEKLPNILIHGHIPDAIYLELSKYKSIEFSHGHISELEYERLFQNFKNIIFLYEPAVFSYCSSGRLCDAILASNTIFVPTDTALSDFTCLHGNHLSFDFEDNNALVNILLSEFEVSKKTLAPLPTVHNSISALISMVEQVVPIKEQKSLGIIFWTVTSIGWLISALGYFLNATVFKLRV